MSAVLPISHQHVPLYFPTPNSVVSTCRLLSQTLSAYISPFFSFGPHI